MRVHPAIEEDVRVIDSFIETPGGLMNHYPELGMALKQQRNFLADRPQMLAFNKLSAVRSLMKTEGVEVLESLLDEIKIGHNVNGKTSFEGADFIIFASQLEMMLGGCDNGRFKAMSRAEIVVGVEMLRAMRWIFPQFDHITPLKDKIAVNCTNWPSRPLQAPLDWSREKISEFHGNTMRPAIQRLRKTMPGGDRVMHPEVARGLEDGIEKPPEIERALSGYQQAYIYVIQSIPEGIVE